MEGRSDLSDLPQEFQGWKWRWNRRPQGYYGDVGLPHDGTDRSLGIGGIWISPFFRSPMRDFGYDISDYRDVDPTFGTLEDFRELLSAAHQRGIRIVIDLVLNHTSDEHPWFMESRQDRSNPKADWYIWLPGVKGKKA